VDIFIKNYDRRSVLKGTGLALGAGGGADRLFRGFTGVWKKYLDTTFKPDFKPGASGRVGYEFYMGKKKPTAIICCSAIWAPNSSTGWSSCRPSIWPI